MDCAECQDQILELIEREAIDPVGVRAVLDACPDCRAEFEAMKSTLALADALPNEAPPAPIDAAILRLADAQSAPASSAPPEVNEPTVIPYDQKRVQRLPWAIAAVAALGIGFGYFQASNWGNLSETEMATRSEPLDASPASPVNEPQDDRDDPALLQAGGAASLEEAEAAAREVASAPAAQRASAKTPPPPSPEERTASLERHEVTKRTQAKPDSAPKQEAMPTDARGSAAATPAAARKDASFGSLEAAGSVVADEAFADRAESDLEEARDAPATTAAAAKEKATKASECRNTIAKFEAKRAADSSSEPTADEALEAGLCYAEIGQRRRARKWLERAAAHPETAPKAKAALSKL